MWVAWLYYVNIRWESHNLRAAATVVRREGKLLQRHKNVPQTYQELEPALWYWLGNCNTSAIGQNNGNQEAKWPETGS
jgi:hypothetical protein